MARILVVGGVAAGMSAASQAKRRDPEAEVVVLERGPHVSYGACGMPYNLMDPEREMSDLVVVTPREFREQRGIDLRTGHEALSIDTGRRTVRARDLQAAKEYELSYDALVLATGASAVRPPIPGLELPGVFVLRELRDGEAMKRFVAESGPRRAVIVGAGYIGMEMAEALRGRGLEVAVLEKMPQILPGYAAPIVEIGLEELGRHGVEVETGVTVQAIAKAGAALEVVTDRGAHPADLVLVAVGIRPNVALAKAAGIALGETGAIAVDERQGTSAPGVFGAGDCAEARNLVTGAATWVPLGTTANKQGKVAGANAAGGKEAFPGIVGTAAFKLFDLEVGRTGLGLAEAERAGLSAIASVSKHRTRGHGYPGGRDATTVLVAERGTGRLLGGQMIAGEGVAGRIDVLATALTAQMTVDRLEGLDLAYAPPLAPVYDPVLIAATVAGKALASPASPGRDRKAPPSGHRGG